MLRTSPPLQNIGRSLQDAGPRLQLTTPSLQDTTHPLQIIRPSLLFICVQSQVFQCENAISMETLKIEIEIGDRKFKAEGPADMVREQTNAFMMLTVGSNAESIAAQAAAAAAEKRDPPIPFDKIMAVTDRTVWLTVPTDSHRDALLVLLLGHRQLRGSAVVNGVELLHGMRSSGYRSLRVDYYLQTLEQQAYLTAEGTRQRRCYQLTERGLARAQQLARDFIGRIPKRRAAHA